MNETQKESKKGVIGLIIVILIVLGVLAFLIIDNNNQKNMKKALKAPMLDYFDKYVSVNSTATSYKVTLKMLKEANKNGEKYNLKSLSKCDEDKTYATITIDFSTGKVMHTEYKLNCRKI